MAKQTLGYDFVVSPDPIKFRNLYLGELFVWADSKASDKPGLCCNVGDGRYREFIGGELIAFEPKDKVLPIEVSQ